MASPNAARAVPAAAGDDPREFDRAGRPITLENDTNLRERQAAYVERRFMLPAVIAKTVADLHFAEVQS